MRDNDVKFDRYMHKKHTGKALIFQSWDMDISLIPFVSAEKARSLRTQMHVMNFH